MNQKGGEGEEAEGEVRPLHFSCPCHQSPSRVVREVRFGVPSARLPCAVVLNAMKPNSAACQAPPNAIYPKNAAMAVMMTVFRSWSRSLLLMVSQCLRTGLFQCFATLI
jgi:hypothetical protein